MMREYTMKWKLVYKSISNITMVYTFQYMEYCVTSVIKTKQLTIQLMSGQASLYLCFYCKVFSVCLYCCCV